MEAEIIDWDNIDSLFIADDSYENWNAPNWVDFFALAEQPTGDDDDDAWFCKPDCKHPKTVEDYLKSKRSSKDKFLRSVTISEMLSFRERNRRDAKLRKAEISDPQTIRTKGSRYAHHFSEDGENTNPDLFTTHLDRATMSNKGEPKPSNARKQQLDYLHENPTKPTLRSTRSVRNLIAGKEVLNQITEFCSELKKLANKGAKKGSEEKVSSAFLREMDREKGRMPLLEVKRREGGLR